MALRDDDFARQVRQLVRPLCAAEGFELVFVEWQREPGGWVLRLYLDREGGITLDDCAYISRQVSDLMDVNLDIDVAYRLEVSSPGPRRPLGRPEDFERFKGHRARIRTKEPVGGRRTFTGTANGAEGETVCLLVGAESLRFDFSAIKRAHLINYNGDN